MCNQGELNHFCLASNIFAAEVGRCLQLVDLAQSAGRCPDGDRAIRGAGDQQPFAAETFSRLGEPSHLSHPRVVCSRHRQKGRRLNICGVPDPDCAISRCRGQQTSITRELQKPHSFGVSLELGVTCHISIAFLEVWFEAPNPDVSILTSNSDHTGIGRMSCEA